MLQNFNQFSSYLHNMQHGKKYLPASLGGSKRIQDLLQWIVRQPPSYQFAFQYFAHSFLPQDRARLSAGGKLGFIPVNRVVLL